MSISKTVSRSVSVLALLLLCVAPLAAAERVVFRGIDLWTTAGDGNTFIDFKLNPIPAGFFCAGSAPFDGRIAFKGAAIETDRPGQLRNVDTIVERLDDARFDKRGAAETRVQVRALNLVGTLPLKTSCGAFSIKLILDGDQPVTNMRMVQENARGGYFVAPIALNSKLLFTPITRGSRTPLVLKQDVAFTHNPPEPFTFDNPAGSNAPEKWSLNVDTNGDGRADTILNGTSNFTAGRSSNQKLPAGQSCHWYIDANGVSQRHCVTLCDLCAEP